MLILTILGTGIYGLKLRAFKAAVVAVFGALALFLGIFAGQVVMGFFKGGPDAVQPLTRLIVYLIAMGLFFIVGLAIGAQYWFYRNVRLIAPLDQLLGAAFGFCGGVAGAAAISFLVFTMPSFPGAFFPPPDQLGNPMNLGGPDPVLHLPYRVSQVASLLNRICGGGVPAEGIGAWGAGLAAGPAGRDFYFAYAAAEAAKKEKPVVALEAWNGFLIRYPGTVDRPWRLKAEQQKELLKPFMKSPDAFAAYLNRLMESGDLDAVEVSVKDAERYFPDDPHMQQFRKAAGDVIPTIREIRKTAKENPAAAGRELHGLFRQHGRGPLRALIVSETRAITGSQPSSARRPRTDARPAPDRAPQKVVLPEDIAAQAEREARDFALKCRYAKAISTLSNTRKRLTSTSLKERLSRNIQQMQVMEALHRRAVSAINAARGRSVAVPPGLGFSGHFEGATETYITFKKGRVPGIRSWSQFTPDKILRLYSLFLGDDAEGLETFRRFHRL